MKEFYYTIQDELGIHARPAGMLAKEGKQYQSKIYITKGEKTPEITRLMSVMSLGIKHGDEIRVTVEGPDEDEAARQIEDFFKSEL